MCPATGFEQRQTDLMQSGVSPKITAPRKKTLLPRDFLLKSIPMLAKIIPKWSDFRKTISQYTKFLGSLIGVTHQDYEKGVYITENFKYTYFSFKWSTRTLFENCEVLIIVSS